MNHIKTAQAINAAAYDALREARGSLGLDVGQTAAHVADATLKAAWDSCVDLYSGNAPDIHHTCGRSDGDGCNLCILSDFATAIGRPEWMRQLEQTKPDREPDQ